MILYVSSAHALKDEMKADSICVLFMSEEGIGLEQKRESGAWKVFQEAFPYTVPIFAGFWFVAFSYGIYMHSMGFGFLYPALGGICPSCGVFAEGHSFLFGKSWCAGGAVSCGDGRDSCMEEKYASFHGGRYGMLHGADKGFVESGKYGKPGKYFLGFLNLFLWNLFICTPAMICFIIMGRPAINALRV